MLDEVDEVAKKLRQIGCKLPSKKVRNWESISKEDCWNMFSSIFVRWDQSRDHEQLTKWGDQMKHLRSVLRGMDLGHKMPKKADFKPPSKKKLIRLLSSMLAKLEDRYAGCFEMSYKWKEVWTRSKPLQKNQKRKAVELPNASKRRRYNNTSPLENIERERLPKKPQPLPIPTSEYMFDPDDADPFRQSTKVPMSKPPSLKPNVREKPKIILGEMNISKVDSQPPNPLSPPKQNQKDPPVIQKDPFSSLAHQVSKAQETQTTPKIRKSPILNIDEPIASEPELEKGFHQQLPERVNEISEKKWKRLSLHADEEIVEIPSEPIGETFLDRKMKEFWAISRRDDIGPKERLKLMDENKREREQFVLQERTRFQEEVRKLGLKMQWDDIMEPEDNFSRLKYFQQNVLPMIRRIRQPPSRC